MVIKSLILVFENVADKKMLNIFLLSCLIASTLSAPSHSIVKKSGNVPAVSFQNTENILKMTFLSASEVR